MEKYAQLNKIIDETSANADKFFQPGNETTGARFKTALEQIKTLVEEIKVEIDELKKKKGLENMLFSNRNKLVFDISEIVAELEMPVREFKPLRPLKSGDHIDDFVLIKDNFNKREFLGGSGTNNSALLRQFSGKPTVISFYSSQWREHGLDHLKHLNFLQNEIKAMGANLVIVTPDDENESLKKIIWDNSLSLNFYFDEENFIAQQFGIYSDADPAWNKYAGIDVNIPLLATYILDTDKQIIFDHIDKDLQQTVLSDELLYALSTGSSYAKKRKSA